MTHPRDSHPGSDDTEQSLADALRRSRTLVDAPESLVLRAIDTFSDRARTARAAPATAGRLQRLLATLTFDSAAAGPLALGMRSAGQDDRQLLFSVEGRDIDLRISAVADGWRISGQILGPDEVGTIELLGREICLEVAWNDLQEFQFAAVPKGLYAITLRSAAMELVLPDIEIPGARGAG
ncbi:MAG: hypothetical protein HC809_15825 [Gammaproteobacteria bacterium]|nr:hypothetical protein [Gammaproteobacteria bacterium]